MAYRDVAAIAAMRALIEGAVLPLNNGFMGQVARESYALADTMWAERTKNLPGGHAATGEPTGPDVPHETPARQTINGGRPTIRIEALNWPDGQEYIEQIDACYGLKGMPPLPATPERRKALMSALSTEAGRLVLAHLTNEVVT